MSSAVYFKFKASLKQYTIPFDGSAISVKDFRNAIKVQCGFKSSDFELQIIDKQGKEYSRDDDLIPKFSDLIVRRLPKATDPPKKKIHNPEDMTRRDPYKSMNNIPKFNPLNNAMNLAKSNIPDDEKIDIMAKRISDEYSEKNYQVKSKPYGVPPPSYICNKCHQSGHWIHECPGLRDKDGRLLDFKTVKRPTGIPQDFLLEVQPGTPGAYLTKEGKYMVPIKDAEAYALGKREKRPFSLEENPPYIEKEEELPTKFKCPLCTKLFVNPTNTPCCSSVFCSKCISDYLYDPEVNGSRKCPICSTTIEHHTSLIENEFVRQLIQCWKANMLTKEIVDRCVTTPSQFSIKKTELNEDSSKSPEMKYDSASADVEIRTIVKDEEDKIFVNNRRLLKPKVLAAAAPTEAKSPSTSTADSTSIVPAATTSDAVSPTDTTTSVVSTAASTAVPTKNTEPVNMKQDITDAPRNTENEPDVDDFIFGKVEDNELSKPQKLVEPKPVPKSVARDRYVGRDTNQRIETISKRSNDNIGGGRNNIERKYEINKGFAVNGRNDHKHSGGVGSSSNFGSNIASTLQAVSAILQSGAGGDGSRSNMLNQFNAGNIVSSVQQQLLGQQQQHSQHHQQQGHGLPVNSGLESLQWPLLNSALYNSLPLQSVMGAVNPALNAAWINSSFNLTNAQAKRVLTEDEFYERQRLLRAQKYNRRTESSGSQSPRNRNHRKRRRSNEGSSRHQEGGRHSGTSRRQQRRDHRPEPHGRERSESPYDRRRPVKMEPTETQLSVPLSSDKANIKGIDPKLMHDSINIFLKYLNRADSLENQDMEKSTGRRREHRSRSSVADTTSIRRHKRSHLREDDSTSPVKMNRSPMNQRMPSPQVQAMEEPPIVSSSYSDLKDDFPESPKESNKSRKPKIKLEEVEDEESSKKHKKHKHKKSKKSKKSKKVKKEKEVFP